MKRLFIIYFLSVSTLFCQEIKNPKQFFSVGASAGFPGWGQIVIKSTGAGQMPRRAFNPQYSSLGISAGYSVRTKTKDLLLFQFEVQRNETFYTFRPPEGYKYLQTWNESDGHLDFLSSVQYNWLHNLKDHSAYDEYNYVRVSTGISSFHRNSGEKLHKNRSKYLVENGDGMNTRIVSVNKTVPILMMELGKKFIYLRKNTSLDIGLVFYHSLNSVFTKEYEFFDKGTSVSKCEITYKGSAIVLNVRYAFNFTKWLKNDTIPIEKKKAVYQLMSVNGRKVEVEHVITVGNENIEVALWDKNEMDSDRVDVYLNDKIIATNMMLLRTKQKIILNLVEGANYLVFYATDMGIRPPVTTAARIFKNSVPKNRSFTSNENESGAWKIIYKPPRGSR
jgi:hypothetical protein